MKSKVQGIAATAVAIAATSGLVLGGSERVDASQRNQSNNDLALRLITPSTQETIRGIKPVEVSAMYEANTQNEVTSIELYVDGVKAATKDFRTPESRGMISFLIDASALTSGPHKLVIRAVAQDAQVVSVTGSFIFGSGEQSNDTIASPLTPSVGSAPVLSLASPTRDATVSGTVLIPLRASDPSGKDPYVSVFVDRVFKTLKNYPPYDYEWDTTSYSNGYHTIEAYGYNDAQTVGHARALKLYVNNPGGRTELRTDLKDAAPVAQPKFTARKQNKTSSVDTGISTRQSHVVRPIADAALAPAQENGLRMAAIEPKHLAANSDNLFGLIGQQMTSELASPFVKPAAHHAEIYQTAQTVPTISKTDVTTGPMLALETPLSPELLRSHGTSLLRISFDASAFGLQSTSSNPTVSPKDAVPTVMHSASKPAVDSSDAVLSASVGQPNIRMPLSSDPIRLASVDISPETLSKPFLMSPDLPIVHQTLIHVTRPIAPEHKTIGIHVAAAPAASNLLRAAGQTSVWFNTIPLKIDRPLNVHGSILFSPLRQVFEFEGGTLDWAQKTNTVTARTETKDLTIQIGNPNIILNKHTYKLTGTPYLQQGRTMVPLSLLPLALDVNVQYDDATGHLMIKSRE